MAGSVRRTSGDDDELDENHEINVTPFIDVMLVLLIIFMVAAPLATVDVNVDLPASNAQAQPRPDKPLFLTVEADLSLSLGDTEVARAGLGSALDQLTGDDKEARIFLRADQVVSYGELMTVMNLLREAGYLKIALVGLEALSGVPTDGGPPTGGGTTSPVPDLANPVLEP
ncbi:TonB system transport protein ExbD [Devosia alba]|uniref:TonB system transport protein ExbD n=1 Tax=Devosia alba TaxID=3152360 RepID=UPI0032630B76